ncbi:MAG: tetratricopeptide repeat protein [Gemmatimonadetes bacterium]|nr:tetratricopeptide repeat protein [Gemmatimonadota bacterium]
MSIEALKEQARRHEQKEEWQKPLAQYSKAIDKLAEEEQPDIGLYNRVGDLCVRVGDLDAAVEHYEQSVAVYMEAFLPNNAIAVCKKIIRNVPDRHDAYLKMGQIRGEQGFIPDARTNFLTYAERMQQAGDLDESFRALVEFCDLAPAETDVRIVVADQMASQGRTEDAVAQLTIAHGRLTAKGDPAASDVEAKIRDLDPNADVSSQGAAVPAMASGDLVDSDDLMAGQFGEISHSGEEEPKVAVASADELAAEVPAFAMGDEDDADAGAELPTFASGDGEDEASESPTLEGHVGDGATSADLPGFGSEEAFVAGADEARDEAAEEAVADVHADETEAVTLDDVRARIAADPSDIALRQRMVEMAYGLGDDSVLAEAFLGLAQTLTEAGEPARAQAAYQQVLQADPGNEAANAAMGAGAPARPVREVAANEDYIDLGAMILGDEPEKTTRFTVAYEEPSGDEAADFAKMLSQFEEKVSENLDADDVKAHHDLGTAYKEMGLLDEAISEFQAALRASSEHLATYELIGQTLLEMGKPEAAVKSLTRALEVEYEIEDDLVGIYYYLARAHEAVGDTASAVDSYDRVFSLDINFADVTERLRALR